MNFIRKVIMDKKAKLLNIISSNSFKTIVKSKASYKSEINHGEDMIDMLLKVAKLRQNEGNKWSASQHRKAARTIKIYCKEKGGPIESVEEAKKLNGIGKGIAAKIKEFLETGELSIIKEQSDKFKKLEKLTDIWGVGNVTANKWLILGIKNIGDVRKSVIDEIIKPTSQQKIGIKYYEDFKQKMNRAQMKQIGQKFCNSIGEFTNEYKLKICGSYRRKKDQSKDADILIYPIVENPKIESKELLERMIKIVKEEKEIMSFGKSSLFGVIEIDDVHRRFDCWVCKWNEIPFAQLAWTGSGQFNIELRKIAMKKGWKLTDKDLTDKNGDDVLLEGNSIRTEKDIFEVLDIKFRVPSKRD